MNCLALPIFLLSVSFSLVAASLTQANEWRIPVAGNAFRTTPEPGNQGLQRNGTMAWSGTKDVFSVYFHVSGRANVQLKLNANASAGRCELAAEVAGQSFRTTLDGDEFMEHEIGRVEIKEAGYVRMDLKGVSRTGDRFAEIRDIIVVSDSEGLKLDYVTTNEGNMFYWGRRGPSVHLTYEVPRESKLRYAYSEITVPEGQDPIGSYYMANGFGEGYFGIQVNGPQERRVLFSVWSPFKTDNPREIPDDERIATVAKGPDVHIGEFGNEGSGGQSYLVYPWKAGTTYCFLTEVLPDGEGNTRYMAWFGEKAAAGKQQWRLVAGFQRPKTSTHLTGFHSFLESFAAERGYLGRRASYGNIWVRDIQDTWQACTRARFSVDATGRGRHRLDFTGGVTGDAFYLRNCGFFNETGTPGQVFERQTVTSQPPKIDFDALPRG